MCIGPTCCHRVHRAYIHTPSGHTLWSHGTSARSVSCDKQVGVPSTTCVNASTYDVYMQMGMVTTQEHCIAKPLHVWHPNSLSHRISTYIFWRCIKACHKQIMRICMNAKCLQTVTNLWEKTRWALGAFSSPTPVLVPHTPRDAPTLYTSSECNVLVVVPAPCNDESARWAATCTTNVSTTCVGEGAQMGDGGAPDTKELLLLIINISGNMCIHTLVAFMMAASGSSLPETIKSLNTLR